MTNETSYVKINKSNVISKCTDVIKEIIAIRKYQDDVYRESFMNKYYNNISKRAKYFWFLGYKTKSKEQIIIDLKEKYGDNLDFPENNLCYFPSNYAWGSLTTAKLLLEMAKNSDDEYLFVGSGDFNLVWMKEDDQN